MREPHERLQHARRKAGYDGAAAAAAAFGWNENTYRSHENGTRGLRVKAAERYAKALRVSASWLLTGDGEGTTKAITIDPDDLRKIVVLLLRAQGTNADLADELADTVVRSLSAPPLAAVGRDLVRSVEVLLELRERQPSLLAAR